MTASRALLACLIAALPAAAQILVDPRSPEGKSAVENFDRYFSGPEPGKLACSVTHYPPTLDYGLRLWTGFNALLPASQFPLKSGDSAVVMFRVSPTSAPANPAYFWMRFDVPVKPPQVTDVKKLAFNVGGGFLLGPGKYSVDWFMIDKDGRRCTQRWKLAAPARNVGGATLPNTVEPVDRQFWSGFPENPERPSHVTIFVHAAPIRPRRYVTRLSPWDRQVLLSTLTALLRDSRFTSASVVLFDLQRRQVLFRDTVFQRRSMRNLARQLASVDLGTISVEALTSGPTPGQFLESMLRTELKEPTPSDAFVFVGTTWRAGPKIPPPPPDLKEAIPPTWFLAFTSPATLSDADSVGSLVRAVKGKVVSIYGPDTLAAGIRSLNAPRAAATGQ